MERTHQHSDSPNSLPSCTHIFAKGRHCRQAVAKSGDLFCAVHAPSHALAAPPDPLAELASELGEITEIHQVSQFLAKVLKLACQNVISIGRAAALTYIANSLLNSLRLQNSEERIAAKEDPEKLVVDWTDVPRPERDRAQLANLQTSDTLRPLVSA
jgi:hypothetical protein